MDYKYIQQLLERYWNADTSLEEERILKAFFSQDNLPEDLKKYKSLFAYEQQETEQDVLGEDFDERILKLTEGVKKVKARRITMTQRLMPLFKAAAVVAIVLMLGNAMQMPFNHKNAAAPANSTEIRQGVPVAMTDSNDIDSAKTGNVITIDNPSPMILK
jgi:hypothetical protein